MNVTNMQEKLQHEKYIVIKYQCINSCGPFLYEEVLYHKVEILGAIFGNLKWYILFDYKKSIMFYVVITDDIK